MHASRPFWSVAVVFGVVLGAGSISQLHRATVRAGEEKGEDAKAREEDDALAKQRLALMHDRVAAFGVKSKEEGLPQRFETRPIFRYSDPARGIVSAAIWRLGPKGRPKALISTELMPKFYGRPRIVYEFLSLTETPFQTASGDYRWEPTSSALTMKPISKGPPPAAGAPARLLQLKQLATRFRASEMHGEEERCELRLMPTPIERYAPGEADRADGAIFLLSYGINPEALLFIESDGTDWTYGFARLGAAVITADLDDEPAWEVGPAQYGLNSNYTATNAPAIIPGIDP